MAEILHIIVGQYENGWTAYPLELDGAVSQGKSKAEALKNVKNAIALYLETFGCKNLLPKEECPLRVEVVKMEMPS